MTPRVPAPLRRALVRRALVATRWRVEVRLPAPVDVGWRALPLVRVEVDDDPPAAGPEVQIGFDVRATSAEIAERVGRRMFERLGYTVLASRARRP